VYNGVTHDSSVYLCMQYKSPVSVRHNFFDICFKYL